MAALAFVGEAWGEDEDRLKHPFVGASGRELLRMCIEAGIVPPPARIPYSPADMRDYWLTQDRITLHNVFNLRPPGNDIELLCGPKSQDTTGRKPIKMGKYIKAEYLPHVERLRDELQVVRPRIVVALGNVASWALLGATGITSIRGNITTETLTGLGFKCLPTFHPAAILRQWELRSTTVFDLKKASRESAFPDVRRPQRTVYVDPTLRDMEWFYDSVLQSAPRIAFDIETRGDQITCIGFAPNPRLAFVVPLVDLRRPDNNYWPTAREERLALRWVAKVLALPAEKIAQNGLYDIGFLWRQWRIPVVNFVHDTMLLHHSLQPEAKKGLGFLGSIYTAEASWKLMRSDTIKRDE